jgi:hypothetical protein
MASTRGSARRPPAAAAPAPSGRPGADDVPNRKPRSTASRPIGRRGGSTRSAPGASRTADDPVTAALAIWTAVTSGLEAAHYAEVGAEYAKLSVLLAQQRTAQLLAGTPPGPEWTELARTAQHALDLLEPLLGAARLLATLPAEPVPATRPPRQVPAAPRPARTAAPHT